MMRLDAAWTLPIGPGRLVAVAGPSGAGKDTLLRFARNHLGGDPNIVFPHRVVTRQPSAAEDHHAFSEADFAAAVAAGGFAFWDVRVVLVTAPADVLAARLAARGRATDGALATRLTRSAPARSDLAPDVVIENVGDPQDGGEKLIAAISCST